MNNENATLVSVIIPTYNRAYYIENAIKSVLAQTLCDIDCIVVDDGSTDNTREKVEKFKKKDSRVKYIYQENSGMAAARNTGIKNADGKWIQFLDSDDWIHSDKLRFQIEFYEKHGLSKFDEIVLYSDYESIWYDCDEKEIRRETRIVGNLNNKQLLDWVIAWEFTHDFPLIIHSMLFKSKIFKHLMFNSNFLSYADIEFETNLLLNGVKFCYTPIVGAIYRKHQNNTTKDWRRIRHYYIDFLEGILEKDENLLKQCPNIGRLIKETINEQDKITFNRLISLVKNSAVPVFLSESKINYNHPILLKLAFHIKLFRLLRQVDRIFGKIKRSVAKP